MAVGSTENVGKCHKLDLKNLSVDVYAVSLLGCVVGACAPSGSGKTGGCDVHMVLTSNRWFVKH